MKAVLRIKNIKTGAVKALATVMNNHISGNSVELALQEFTRQGGILPSLKEDERVAVELR